MKKNFYKAYFQFEQNHWLMKVRRKIIHDIIERNSMRNPKKTNILDFGCASGLLVKELSEKKYLAYGIDVSKEAIAFGKRQGIKNLYLAESKRMRFPNKKFDIILALDVLEHIKDERMTIKEIFRLLKPNGLFIITVPAFQFLWGKHDDVSQHYRRYVLGNLLTTVKSHGKWEIVKSSYFNFILFLPIAIIRITSRLFNINNRESDFNINNNFLDNIFLNIFNLERTCLRYFSFPFGVSILLVLRKK